MNDPLPALTGGVRRRQAANFFPLRVGVKVGASRVGLENPDRRGIAQHTKSFLALPERRRSALFAADGQDQTDQSNAEHGDGGAKGPPQVRATSGHRRFAVVVQRADEFQDAADVSLLPIGLRTVGMAVVTGYATGLHAIGDGVTQGGPALEIFEAIERLIGMLPQLAQGLGAKGVPDAAGFLAPRERIVAVEPDPRAGS